MWRSPYHLPDLVQPLVATPGLRVWAAGIRTGGVPSWLQRADVTLALRATPRLVGEVQAGFDKYHGIVLPYAAETVYHTARILLFADKKDIAEKGCFSQIFVHSFILRHFFG